MTSRPNLSWHRISNRFVPSRIARWRAGAARLYARRATPAVIARHERQWCEFRQFGVSIGARPLPATATTVASYVAYLSEQRLAFGSIMSHLTSLRQRHELCGCAFPSDSFVQGVLAGAAAAAPPAGVRRRAPLTVSHLLSLARVPAPDPVEEALCWLVIVLLFWSCRRSSFLVCSTRSARPRAALRWRDVRVIGPVGSRRADLVQRLDKTHRNQVPWIVSVSELSIRLAPICPVRALVRWRLVMTARGGVAHGEALVASWPSGDALTLAFFNRHLRSRCTRAGFDIDLITLVSSHSLRRGAATSADAAGAARGDIKLLGGWASDAVDVYLAASHGARRAQSQIGSLALVTS